MNIYPKITKRNRKQKLGRFNRELVIRLTKKREEMAKPVYHLVLARRRSRARCRYDKLGFLELFKDKREKYNTLGINMNKLRKALCMGASIHVSVYKLIFP